MPTDPPPRCCGEPMEHLDGGVWQCDPCGCLHTTTIKTPCPDHA